MNDSAARWISRLRLPFVAVSVRCVLLTANTRDFSSISGLRIENWLE